VNKATLIKQQFTFIVNQSNANKWSSIDLDILSSAAPSALLNSVDNIVS